MSPQNSLKIKQAVNAIAEGRVVIVVDDEDRENEGDFIAAAEKVTPEMINFMATHGRGLICVTILEDLAERLQLGPAVEQNTSLHNTAFTVSIDAASCRTGISAFERCDTVRQLLAPEAKPEDLARPGHIFPIVAQSGGVLRRAGHTEASVDLARLAGLYPAGMLCEIMNEAGDMARGEELERISERFGCPIISIEELIRYRRRHEKLVWRVATADFPTEAGNFNIIGYHIKYEQREPFALVLGDLNTAEAPLVRMHASTLTGDALNALRGSASPDVRQSLEMIAREGAGALVYLPRDGEAPGLSTWIHSLASPLESGNGQRPSRSCDSGADPRDYGIGIQILKDLGLSRVRLLTNQPKPSEAFIFDGYELEVVDQVPLNTN